MATTPVTAGEISYESSRCQHMENMSSKDKALDVVFRKFRRIQSECCDNSVAKACESGGAYIACKALANGGFKGATCPSACKAWAEDCAGFVTLSNREVKDKLEEAHGILNEGD